MTTNAIQSPNTRKAPEEDRPTAALVVVRDEDRRPSLSAIGPRATHALLRALDRAADRAAVEQALRSWAAEYLGAIEVMVELGHGAEGCSELDERSGRDDQTVFVADARGTDPARIIITCARPTADARPAVRQTLAVAGRLFGAALARVRAADAARAAAVAPARAQPAPDLPTLLGMSRHGQQLAAMVSRLADCEVSVLVDGETGVGKTFIARLIHEASARAGEPLRIVNCSAIPESLFESQLFGHERGAFTGAVGTQIGLLEAAGAGTIVFDEIGELSPASQAKLLHVLEERRFERVGSTRPIELRARLLFATNRDLSEMVRVGRFRQDLLFRISVVRLNVPPLRQRGDDLLVLAHRVLAELAKSAKRKVTGFSPEALELIRSHGWPGNVRELRNAIEHALALGDTPLIAPQDFPGELAPKPSPPDDADLVRLPLPLDELERRAIEASLRATEGNRCRAAKMLGVTRQTLYNKLKAHKLEPREPASGEPARPDIAADSK